MPTFTRFFRDWRYRCFYGLLLRRGYPLETLGDPGGICQWTICSTGLGPRSVVYSGGLGSDITFEHELVERFGCQVALFDPSPTGQQTMSRPENQRPEFHYSPAALAGYSGKLGMAPPKPGEDSWFAREGQGEIEVPCVDLVSMMRQKGHERIDLLKLDIEGSEYGVLADLLRRRIPVRQIAVEYHHGILPGIRRSQTIKSMLALLARGYKLLDQTGLNHTFFLKRWPDGPRPA